MLEIDDFAMSLGSLSVGLPSTRTADDLYRRYLELLRLARHGSASGLEPPEGDVAVLVAATGRDRDFVVGRLRALQ